MPIIDLDSHLRGGRLLDEIINFLNPSPDTGRGASECAWATKALDRALAEQRAGKSLSMSWSTIAARSS